MLPVNFCPVVRIGASFTESIRRCGLKSAPVSTKPPAAEVTSVVLAVPLTVTTGISNVLLEA
ncbi:hypothetical protein D3C73_1585760 [compost metagenome]